MLCRISVIQRMKANHNIISRKFGTTRNPFTRYSQSFLKNTVEGLQYTSEFSGTLKQATILERMKILNFKARTGFLLAGNKIVR